MRTGKFSTFEKKN